MKKALLCSPFVSLLMCASAWAAAECLVTNGNFDDGVGDGLNGWLYDSAPGSASEFMLPNGKPTVGPAVGNFAPGASATDPAMVRSIPASTLSGSNWIYQILDTEPGKQYNINGMFAGGIGQTTDTTASASWEVILYAGDYDVAKTMNSANAVASHSTTGGAGTQFGWTPVVGVLNATDVQYTLALRWTSSQAITAPLNTMGAYFDSFCISEVPEPASLALLGLAIPFIRRRRA